jgi:hypothetical protein
LPSPNAGFITTGVAGACCIANSAAFLFSLRRLAAKTSLNAAPMRTITAATAATMVREPPPDDVLDDDSAANAGDAVGCSSAAVGAALVPAVDDTGTAGESVALIGGALVVVSWSAGDGGGAGAFVAVMGDAVEIGSAEGAVDAAAGDAEGTEGALVVGAELVIGEAVDDVPVVGTGVVKNAAVGTGVVGVAVGACVGVFVGALAVAPVGVFVGELTATPVGVFIGALVASVGVFVGALVASVGVSVGAFVGDSTHPQIAEL